MAKIRIDIDALDVETFEVVSPEGGKKGTVLGHHHTVEATCPETCGFSCGGSCPVKDCTDSNGFLCN